MKIGVQSGCGRTRSSSAVDSSTDALGKARSVGRWSRRSATSSWTVVSERSRAIGVRDMPAKGCRMARGLRRQNSWSSGDKSRKWESEGSRRMKRVLLERDQKTYVSRRAFARHYAACSPVIESSPKSLRSMAGCAADGPAPGDMFVDGSFQSSFAFVRASCRSWICCECSQDGPAEYSMCILPAGVGLLHAGTQAVTVINGLFVGQVIAKHPDTVHRVLQGTLLLDTSS